MGFGGWWRRARLWRDGNGSAGERCQAGRRRVRGPPDVVARPCEAGQLGQDRLACPVAAREVHEQLVRAGGVTHRVQQLGLEGGSGEGGAPGRLIVNPRSRKCRVLGMLGMLGARWWSVARDARRGVTWRGPPGGPRLRLQPEQLDYPTCCCCCCCPARATERADDECGRGEERPQGSAPLEYSPGTTFVAAWNNSWPETVCSPAAGQRFRMGCSGAGPLG
jgi:hypothetical protein